MIEALIYKGMDTEIVYLNGRTMLPGFIDPHIHMCSTMFGHWLDLSPFVNVDME
jgi:predicted amidohydrolase YtcJ